VDTDYTQIKFWFSHQTTKYEIIGSYGDSDAFDPEYIIKKVRKTNEKIKLDWNDCTLDVIGKLKDEKDENKEKLKIVLRSNSTKKSVYMGESDSPKDIRIRYMLGIDVANVSDIMIEDYKLSEDNYLIRENIGKNALFEHNDKRQRIVFQLDDRYWIWDWYDGIAVENTLIYKLHQYILSTMESASEIEKGTFKINLNEDELDPKKLEKSHVIPIIYQPALDSLKNYIRQVHCAEIEPNVYEISIIFNNEVLRKHKIFDGVYKFLRQIMYQRITDIETFRIHVDSSSQDTNNTKCLFEKIYSDDFGIEYDSIHGDPPKANFRDLKYSLFQYSSPIIFINTSNHAMAEHDNNHDIWKWEYIPFLKDSPIEFGNLSRKDLEDEIRNASSKIENWAK